MITIREQTNGREHQVEAGVGQTLLEVAGQSGVAIEHTCGGVGACSTCHVWVRSGGECLSEADDNELDRLTEAPGVSPESRLACQARISRPGNVVVEVPRWNRNAVKEG